MRIAIVRALPFVAFFALAACSSSSSSGTQPKGDAGAGAGDSGAGPKTDAEYEAAAVQGMHDQLLTDIDALLVGAKAIQSAAPDDLAGWSDPAKVDNLKAAWVVARAAYEHSEGAIAPYYPDIDAAIDARYDDFLAALGPTGDDYLFDGTGVTGMHAIERIVYQTVTPAAVIEFEATLPGYKAAAFPATEQEASDFKNKLCAQLITDVTNLRAQWAAANLQNLGVAIAYQGLIALMNEQQEKVNKAASSEEESRYSQHTMVDLRDNLEGTKTIYGVFQPWVQSKTNATDPTSDGPTIDAKIQSGFTALGAIYSQISGDAFPAVPTTWSSESPSASDLATPFGQLYTGVHHAVDANTDGSIVFEMNAAATVLGFPTFTH